MWGCVLTPASGCFTPNHNSETNTSQGKAGYIIISFFIMYRYFVEQKYVLYNRGKGCGFYESEKR
jgi:hypothetical protein